MVGDIFQPTHLLFVLVVALLVLGPKRLPEVGRQLGNGIRDFRAAINGERAERSEPGPALPAEPELAHTPSETPDAHVFAHGASETVVDEHTFAHGAPETVVHEHPVAPEASHLATPETTKPAGEHEFAYEASPPAEKRAGPLT
jgi:sec-independent protein translocase protein TatA